MNVPALIRSFSLKSILISLVFTGQMVCVTAMPRLVPGMETDTLLTDRGGIVIRNGGIFSNQGTVVLSGNLSNMKDSLTSLGNGIIGMTDTVRQTISGRNVIGSLRIDNPAGIQLAGQTKVTDTLGLNNGRLILGAHHLCLGAEAIITGTPSATTMIVATGTGELRKSFNGAGSFTFPVGDDTATAGYSPVTLDFDSGSFNQGNYAGVRLANSPYPGLGGNNINRYWVVTGNDISGFRCNASFSFLPSDLPLGGSPVRCVRVLPDSVELFNESPAQDGLITADSLNGFGIFTGIQRVIPETLNLTLFLESLYSGPGTMRQARNEEGPQFPGSIADHISLELHDATDYSGKVLTIDHIPLSTSGNAQVTLPGTFRGSYYITVRHRNSIETTSAEPVSLISDTTGYYFVLPERAFGNNLKMMPDGWYVIYGGDVNQDGSVDTGDSTPVDNDAAAFVTGYVETDVNGDGAVDTGDGTIVDNNSAAFVIRETP